MAEMKLLIVLEQVDNLMQKVPNWEERVIYQMCVLPFRKIWKGWENGLAATL